MITVATTSGLLEMCKDADTHERNRRVKTEKLSKEIDPEGIHILKLKFNHNGREFRTMWMVKMKNTLRPQDIMVDVGFDVFNNNIEFIDEKISAT